MLDQKLKLFEKKEGCVLHGIKLMTKMTPNQTYKEMEQAIRDGFPASMLLSYKPDTENNCVMFYKLDGAKSRAMKVYFEPIRDKRIEIV